MKKLLIAFILLQFFIIPVVSLGATKEPGSSKLFSKKFFGIKSEQVVNAVTKINPLYDIFRSFEENCKEGPLCKFIPKRPIRPKSQWYFLLGYPVASQIGIPACAIMTSKGIALAAQLGFDVLTYKTIRSSKVTSYKLPNICYVSCNQQITNKDIGNNFYK